MLFECFYFLSEFLNLLFLRVLLATTPDPNDLGDTDNYDNKSETQRILALSAFGLLGFAMVIYSDAALKAGIHRVSGAADVLLQTTI